MDALLSYISDLSIPGLVLLVLLGLILLMSVRYIGSTSFATYEKRFGKSLPKGQFIALKGEAGDQPDLLMPGLRVKLWPLYKISVHRRGQVPPDGIGVIVAQVGGQLASGKRTAPYNQAHGDFSDVRAFLTNDGQLGVQQAILRPGATFAIHPKAFVVKTYAGTFGKVLDEGTGNMLEGLTRDQLSVTKITPQVESDGEIVDVVGVVTVLEGRPQESGSISNRLGGFKDIADLEAKNSPASEIITTLFTSQNEDHDSYQDFGKFVAGGGRIGLQHDTIGYGTYLFNPFLVDVEIVDMLVVQQGEVAVVKAYTGLATLDTSGETYKFGSIVAPGHMGVWSEPLRTGKYSPNPRLYEVEIVPTSILTLNWANSVSEAHNLDSRLSSINAKTMDGFDFKVDLQVLIHVPDTKASRVIGMVGTMQNLVNEVLQSAVGNYVRNALQKLTAIEFIEKREQIQRNAEEYVTDYLQRYDVEVRGVYIQDVVFPPSLVEVLNAREIAKQQKTTYETQKEAELAKVMLENQRGTAAAQADLAAATVGVDIERKKAEAAVVTAEGAAKVTRMTGEANAFQIARTGAATAGARKAAGLADAASYAAQGAAIGEERATLVALARELQGTKLVPDTMVSSGGTGGSNALESLVTLVLSRMAGNSSSDRKGFDPAEFDTAVQELDADVFSQTVVDGSVGDDTAPAAENNGVQSSSSSVKE